MLKWIETTGRSEEDAISAALFQLGLDRDDVSVEVIERAKSGFLGFGSNPAKVRVSYNEVDGRPAPMGEEGRPQEKSVPTPVEETVIPAVKPMVEKPVAEKKSGPAPVAESPAAPVEEETILSAKPGMAPPKPRQSRPERRERPRREDRLREGDEVLIGSAPKPREPVTMDPAAPDDAKANQIKTFLTGLLGHLQVEAAPEIFITNEGNYKVILQGDAEGYRAKREESLQRLAVKVAGKVVKYRKNMTLEPMNAYERHVIHTALQDFKGVTTYSTGVEPNRRTVVAYAPHQR